MSQENVEIVRRAFEQFTREGWEPLMVRSGTLRSSGICRRRESPALGPTAALMELRSFFEDWFSTFPFEEWEQELDEVVDCGERVVALTRQRGHGSASGAVTELEYAQVIKLREGKVVEVDMYIDRDKALEAAGLSE